MRYEDEMVAPADHEMHGGHFEPEMAWWVLPVLWALVFVTGLGFVDGLYRVASMFWHLGRACARGWA
jgi:hypothetical protein